MTAAFTEPCSGSIAATSVEALWQHVQTLAATCAAWHADRQHLATLTAECAALRAELTEVRRHIAAIEAENRALRHASAAGAATPAAAMPHPTSPARPARRAALAGMLGVAAGLALVPRAAAAASGDPVRAGQSVGCTGTTQITTTTGTGLRGRATATSGDVMGLHGVTASPGGAGVFGVNMASTGVPANGVVGQSLSTHGVGVYGVAATATGPTIGVRGRTNSPTSTAVKGEAVTNEGSAIGVSGESSAPGGYGVFGYAKATAGVNYGVYGRSDSPTTGWAVWAQGRLRVTGRSFLHAPNTPPALGALPNSTISFWHEPAASGGAPLGRLHVQIKTSAGQVFRASIPLVNP